MRCEEFEARWNAILDERRMPSSDAEFWSHVSDCRECSQRARACEAVLVGLARARPPGPPGDLARRVLGQIQRPPVVRLGLHRIAAAIAAAAVLALVWPLLWGERAGKGEGKDRAEPVGPPRVARRAPPPPGENPPPLAHLAREATDQYWDLAQETRQSFSSALLILPGVGPPAAPPSAGDRAPTPPADWVHEVADGLEPVTRSTAGAIDCFLRAIPAAEEDARS